jgi:hypothetical protein
LERFWPRRQARKQSPTVAIGIIVTGIIIITTDTANITEAIGPTGTASKFLHLFNLVPRYAERRRLAAGHSGNGRKAEQFVPASLNSGSG